MREEVRGGKFSALAERELLRDVSARIALHPSRLKDEPRQGFISVQFLVSGRESVFNSRHHNRMANHHRAMQSC